MVWGLRGVVLHICWTSALTDVLASISNKAESHLGKHFMKNNGSPVWERNGDQMVPRSAAWRGVHGAAGIGGLGCSHMSRPLMHGG